MPRMAPREPSMRKTARLSPVAFSWFAWMTEIAPDGYVEVVTERVSPTGAWPGVQAFGGWKGSGSTGKSGLSMYYVAQFLREQSHTVVD